MESFLFLASQTYCLLRQKPINLFSEREYALERLQKKIPGISFKCLLITSKKFLCSYLYRIDKTSNFNIIALTYALY